jgi:hypothetical protein
MLDALASTLPEALWRAAELIRVRGFIQKDWTLYDDGGNAIPGACLCAVGAINLATTGSPVGIGDTPEGMDLADMARVFVNGLLPGFETLYAFNDTPGRTAEEVVELLERAARQAEEQERGEATGDPPGQRPDHDGDRG